VFVVCGALVILLLSSIPRDNHLVLPSRILMWSILIGFLTIFASGLGGLLVGCPPSMARYFNQQPTCLVASSEAKLVDNGLADVRTALARLEQRVILINPVSASMPQSASTATPVPPRSITDVMALADRSDNCDERRTGTRQLCSNTISRVISIGTVVNRSANCGSGVVSTELDAQPNCVKVNYNVHGCGYDRVFGQIVNCRGRGWLDVEIPIIGQAASQ
jgi:hypothetical protein